MATPRAFSPTEQQENILAAVRTGENVTVRALAGTGKTSTLVLVAQALMLEHPTARIVYFAFNKSVQTEAQGKFPSNTETLTADAAAHRHPDSVMLKGKMKGKRRQPNLDVLIKAFNINEVRVNGTTGALIIAEKKLLKLAQEAVVKFCISSDRVIEEKHIDYSKYKKVENHKYVGPPILALAKLLWADILDPAGITMTDFPHILKNWALSNPDFSQSGTGLAGPIDIIFFDEAQDINEVIGFVVAAQKAQKIIVGDAHQSIYSWRGAVDYLDKIETGHNLALTKSFRFGPEIAETGNAFLKLLGSDLEVEGAGGTGLVDWLDEERKSVAPDAVITRTRAGAIHAINDQLLAGRTVKVTPNFKDELNQLILSANWLLNENAAWNKRPVSIHKDLEPFNNWGEVIKAAKGENDDDIKDVRVKILYDLVIKYGIDGLRHALNNVVTDDKITCDVTVLTAHTAKGMEWDHVLIFGDFRRSIVKIDDDYYLVSEDVRLAYVSVTRAKKRLSISHGSFGWVNETKTAGLKLDSDKQVQAERAELKLQKQEEFRVSRARATEAAKKPSHVAGPWEPGAKYRKTAR
jgi:hypothetical protein